MDQNEICLERKCQRFLCACDNVYNSQWMYMTNVHKRCFKKLLYCSSCIDSKSCDIV